MMKEKFPKLLLGEDMLGSGKWVCTTLSINGDDEIWVVLSLQHIINEDGLNM